MSKSIDEFDELDMILLGYSDIDDTELGEDKFIGHRDLKLAKQAIKALITKARKEAYKEGRYDLADSLISNLEIELIDFKEQTK